MGVRVLLNYEAKEEDVSQVQAVSPEVIVETAASREEGLARAAEAEVMLAGHWSEELWMAAPQLRWVQSWGAGVEWFLTPDFVASPIILTNAQGVYGVPIAEHIIAFILYFSRAFNWHTRHQLAHQWKHARVTEVYEQTLGIVGLGGIGQEVARRAKGLGMRVIAVRRHPEKPADAVEEVRGAEELPWLLEESDYVALCAALTKASRQLIGENELRQMKQTAYVFNIGRGGLIDEAALITALQEKWIAGAGLDVFEHEPLAAESPLWDMPNVLVTPHTSGSSPRSHERVIDLFCDNLRRYVAGEALRNVVDKAAGY